MPREGGMIIVTDDRGEHHTPTYRCCHCGNPFTVVKGSGRVRGFCQLCNSVTCGSQDCMAHFPFEKKLDLVEAGKIPLVTLR